MFSPVLFFGSLIAMSIFIYGMIKQKMYICNPIGWIILIMVWSIHLLLKI